MKKIQQYSSLALAIAVFAVACADPATGPTRLLSNDVALAITDSLYQGVDGPDGINSGEVEVCKVAIGGSATFTFSVTVNGVETLANESITGSDCITVFTSSVDNADNPDVVVVTEGANPTSEWALTAIDTRRYLAEGLFTSGGYTTPRLDDVEDLPNRKATVYISNDMARRVTFTNTFTAGPVDEICDFVTFGRLITEVGNTRVVISGNVGGVNANATIKNEFHVEVNGVDYHVADAFTYGPILSGPLSGPAFPNSRMATGNAKNGVAVELRVWDGGEPGKGTDWVYIKIGTPGTEWLGANGRTITQGNMQYHPNCRGPGDGTTVSTTSNGKKG